ncbi:MAG: ABC transporter ATP-binding protein [candidate division NC10 bacterium]|nr:ABC transporter ATP-binding protein [candidate division NC10 bacterium]
MDAIRCQGVCKDYRVGFWRRRVRILHDLELTVRAGETFGYLGPNGAGKTTTIKILLGLLHPTAGCAWLCGRDASRPEARAAAGYLPETPTFYDYLTGEEFLAFMARLAGLARSVAREQIPALLDRVGLSGAGSRQLRKYSKGMLQRIGMAQALLGNPALVILDEPMSGLDPIGRKEIRDIMVSLRKEGRTVFFSSHIIPDVEMLCDRVGILLGGRLARVGRLDELLGTEIDSVEVTLAGLPPEAAATDGALAPPLVQGDRVQLRLRAEAEVDALLRRTLAAGGRILSVVPHRRTLEEIFLAEVAERGRR